MVRWNWDLEPAPGYLCPSRRNVPKFLIPIAHFESFDLKTEILFTINMNLTADCHTTGGTLKWIEHDSNSNLVFCSFYCLIHFIMTVLLAVWFNSIHIKLDQGYFSCFISNFFIQNIQFFFFHSFFILRRLSKSHLCFCFSLFIIHHRLFYQFGT